LHRRWGKWLSGESGYYANSGLGGSAYGVNVGKGGAATSLTNAFGSMTFGVDNGSTLAVNRYTNVLTGVTADQIANEEQDSSQGSIGLHKRRGLIHFVTHLSTIVSRFRHCDSDEK
jgi:hypothetical protein